MSERTLHIPERFDFGYHKQFTDQYNLLVEDSSVSNIVLDFNQVAYLDSSALGMMVLFQKKAKSANIKVSIKGAHSSARDILEIAHFDRLFDIS